jgi:hypothetical protein
MYISMSLSMRSYSLVLVLLLSVTKEGISALFSGNNNNKQQPNILFFLADDVGWR